MPPARLSTIRLLPLLPFAALAAACGGDEPAPESDAETDTVGSRATAPARYVGLRHPPLPAGVEKLAGGLAVGPGQAAAEVRFAFQEVRADGRRLLWLSELTRRDAEGVPHWRVVDALQPPEPRPGERLVAGLCRLPDGSPAAAIVRETGSDPLTGGRVAWGVDREAKRLVSVDAREVVCENPGATAP